MGHGKAAIGPAWWESGPGAISDWAGLDWTGRLATAAVRCACCFLPPSGLVSILGNGLHTQSRPLLSQAKGRGPRLGNAPDGQIRRRLTVARQSVEQQAQEVSTWRLHSGESGCG